MSSNFVSFSLRKVWCARTLYISFVLWHLFFFPRELCAGHLLPSETYCMRHFAHVHVKRLAAWITNQTTKKYTIVITSYLPVTKKSSRPTEEKKIGPISSPTQYAEPWLFEPPLRQWANLSGSESNTTWLTAERQRHGYRRYHVWCTYRAMSTWWISHKKNTWWMWTKLNVGTFSVPKWIYLFDHQTLCLTIRLI